MCSSKKGVSSNQLHRTLGCTLKTAWFVSHRLREAMREGHFVMGGEGKTVEIDETYVGGKEKNKHRNKRVKDANGGIRKEAVFSLVERGGSVRSHHVPTVSRSTLGPILNAQLRAATDVMSDGGGARVGSMFASHPSVNHGISECVRGQVHTNTSEGYFSILKRGITGTYHVSPKHLKRYLAEFDFRYNNLVALGVNDTARTEAALRGIVGKRLTYRDSSAPVTGE
jgi:hypothetical protein